MPSSHSTLAPRPPPELGPRRSLSLLIRATGSRITLKPKRDALTRVRHDLRSLVHSVVGYSDLLAESRYGALSSEQTRFVKHVRSAAEHLQELVDTCIELSRPANTQDARGVELPEAPLGQTLRRIRSALAERGVACDVSTVPELEQRVLVWDIPALERALIGLSLVVTRDATVSCTLHVSRRSGRLLLSLRASDATESLVPMCGLEQLEDQVGNRDFVRLKLGEVLLARQGGALRIANALDAVEFELLQ